MSEVVVGVGGNPYVFHSLNNDVAPKSLVGNPADHKGPDETHNFDPGHNRRFGEDLNVTTPSIVFEPAPRAPDDPPERAQTTTSEKRAPQAPKRAQTGGRGAGAARATFPVVRRVVVPHYIVVSINVFGLLLELGPHNMVTFVGAKGVRYLGVNGRLVPVPRPPSTHSILTPSMLFVISFATSIAVIITLERSASNSQILKIEKNKYQL